MKQAFPILPNRSKDIPLNAPTADAPISLVHSYYPPGIDHDDPRYESSVEGQRLTRLIAANVGGTQQWNGFIQGLNPAFPDCFIWDSTVPWHEPCFVCRVSLPGFVSGKPRYDSLVCLLSQLTPVYALYASHLEERGPGLERDHWTRFPPLPLEFQEHEKKLSVLIESALGATRVPNDVLSIPLPDRVPRTGHCQLGEAKLIDCLFTPYRM